MDSAGGLRVLEERACARAGSASVRGYDRFRSADSGRPVGRQRVDSVGHAWHAVTIQHRPAVEHLDGGLFSLCKLYGRVADAEQGALGRAGIGPGEGVLVGGYLAGAEGAEVDDVLDK